MNEPQKPRRRRHDVQDPNRLEPGKSAWADGIRQLYDDITEEPLPAEFQELLDRLSKLSKD